MMRSYLIEERSPYSCIFFSENLTVTIDFCIRIIYFS